MRYKYYVVTLVHLGCVYEQLLTSDEKLARREFKKLLKEYNDPGDSQVVIIGFNGEGYSNDIIDYGPEEN